MPTAAERTIQVAPAGARRQSIQRFRRQYGDVNRPIPDGRGRGLYLGVLRFRSSIVQVLWRSRLG